MVITINLVINNLTVYDAICNLLWPTNADEKKIQPQQFNVADGIFQVWSALLQNQIHEKCYLYLFEYIFSQNFS